MSSPPRAPRTLTPYPTAETTSTSHTCDVLVPRCPTQPWMVPFPVWCERYRYYVDRVFDNLKFVLTRPGAVASFDWDAVYVRLERYLYLTGQSRFKSFTPPDIPPDWHED